MTTQLLCFSDAKPVNPAAHGCLHLQAGRDINRSVFKQIALGGALLIASTASLAIPVISLDGPASVKAGEDATYRITVTEPVGIEGAQLYIGVDSTLFDYVDDPPDNPAVGDLRDFLGNAPLVSAGLNGDVLSFVLLLAFGAVGPDPGTMADISLRVRQDAPDTTTDLIFDTTSSFLTYNMFDPVFFPGGFAVQGIAGIAVESMPVVPGLLLMVPGILMLGRFTHRHVESRTSASCPNVVDADDQYTAPHGLVRQASQSLRIGVRPMRWSTTSHWPRASSSSRTLWMRSWIRRARGRAAVAAESGR